MANVNSVIFIGRLTRDPEYRQVQNGGVVKFGLAVNNPRKVNGQWQDEPCFLDCEAWDRGENKLAERVAQLAKGNQVYVQGKLKQDTWADRTTGEKRTKLLVVADTVQSLEPRQEQQAPARQTDASGLGELEIPF